MRYGSVCSGIEAATVAWHPLGWSPAFFSEIEKFPSAVLAHHYGSNMPGEAYATNGVPNYGDMTEFKEWPDADIDVLVGGTPCQSFSVAGLRKGLDDPRGNLMLTFLAIAKRYRPRYIVWENVLGVLSSDGGRDFGTFLRGVGELGYGWSYRVLDAQYVRVDGFPRAVPQRRRRVFVVGYLGDWRRAAAVLLEPESMRGNHPPRREAGQRVAPTISARARGGGGLGSDFEIDGGLVPGVANPLTARMHKGVNTTGDEGQTMVAHSLRAEGFDASEDGTGRGTPIVPVAFSSKDYGGDAMEQVSPTLRSMHHDKGNPNAGGQVAIAIQERAVSESPANGPDGKGYREDGAAYTLEARTTAQAVAFEADQWAVRRLTPRECERLQGFPDDFTRIPWRNKPADSCPDGPRYRALGNSMAVNVMRWIGMRIQMAEEIAAELERAACTHSPGWIRKKGDRTNERR